MADLSKWDFADLFFLYEAAALIVGIDPAEIYIQTKPAQDDPRIYDHHSDPRIKPVVERMKLSYFEALELYEVMRTGKKRLADWVDPSDKNILRSEAMEIVPLGISSSWLPLEPDVREGLDLWYEAEQLQEGGFGAYEEVKFSRAELLRWLSANGFKSGYQFGQPLAANASIGALPEKPLGTSERNTLLKLVIGMAIQGYAFDPKASKSSQPKEIADDLAELGISVTDDTVRKYLKEAARLYLDGKPATG